jgi:Leucine-rich repeat (LRR) protein
LPDHLPASLRSLDISNNQLIRLPRENPAALRRIAVDPIHPRPNWVNWVQKIVVNPQSNEDLQPSQAPQGKPGPDSGDESLVRSRNIYQRVEI